MVRRAVVVREAAPLAIYGCNEQLRARFALDGQCVILLTIAPYTSNEVS